MKKDKAPSSGGLRKKLLLLCSLLVIAASAAFAIVGVVQLRSSKKVSEETNKSQNEAVKQQSEETMTRLMYENMLKTISLAAHNVDGEFWTMKHDFTLLADQVQDVFEHPDKYGEREADPPDPANAGKLVLQLIYGNEEAANDPETREMVGKLANLAPMMEEIIRGSDEYTRDCYISLPKGATLAMDKASNEKLDKNGEAYPYNPTAFPWYVDAVYSGKFSFTLAAQSLYLDQPEVEYGYPVYVDDELVAVLQGSTMLSVIQDFVSDVSVGENGFSIMVSDEGQLAFSPRTAGELKMVNDVSADIRNTSSEELSKLIDNALNNENGIALVSVDGENFCAAYARMESFGWALITFVPESELHQPTDALLSEMDEISSRAAGQYNANYRTSLILILIVIVLLIVIAFLIAIKLSGKLTRPIRLMTNRIENITGDDFNFEMDEVYRTGDEIEILAGTFGKLSDQIKEHLRNILAMTAEKERVGAELALAARIQADMLPKQFPAFPDRNEFDIYACMTPAKEVGGDFYDFFFVDENRLALVIADVSGKGIPAAMFMMMAKNMIQTQAAAGSSPKDVMETVNKLLCGNHNQKMFVTVWFGLLDLTTGILTASNAGHEYPIIKNPGGPFEVLKDKHGFVIGGMSRMKYTEYELQMLPGSKLFVYTDGVPEATDPEENMFGLERTLKAVNACMDGTPEEILGSVEQSVAKFVKEAEQFDDLTMLCIEYFGK